MGLRVTVEVAPFRVDAQNKASHSVWSSHTQVTRKRKAAIAALSLSLLQDRPCVVKSHILPEVDLLVQNMADLELTTR